MNNDLILGGGGVPQIGGPKLDASDFETCKCAKCGCFMFEPRIVLKKISGTLIGRGTEPVYIPMQILVCSDCGEIYENDIKEYKLEKDVEEYKANLNKPVKA